jgi:orotidine-5'-phosphate decarboxylase
MKLAPARTGNMNSFRFGDAVIERSRNLGHCFCLGLDPHLSMIPSAFRRGDMKAGSSATINTIEDFLVAVIDQAVDRVAAFKPQSAMYERLGSAGIALLERLAPMPMDAFALFCSMRSAGTLPRRRMPTHRPISRWTARIRSMP